TLRSNEGFARILDELTGTENRINVARLDYNDSLQHSKPKRYTKTQSPEFGARFLDNDRILFQKTGKFFVLNTADATLVQLTREANQQNFISVQNVSATKDAKMIAYVVSDTSKNRSLIVPNYIDEFVQASPVRR